MLTGFKSILLLVITTLFSFTNMNAQNLLTNGGFEGAGSGNGFFINQYGLINPVNGTSTPGRYAITSDPKNMDTNFISGGDHTGGGNMLVINGSTIAAQTFWQAGNGGDFLGLTPGTTYTLSFWIKSVSNEVTSSATQALIKGYFINASDISSNIQAPLPVLGWQQVFFTFKANSAGVLIQLQNINTSATGNDFAVDDFELKAGGLPLKLDSNSSTNPTCPSINDGTITATASGGSTPYKYALTGTSSENNSTGKFTGLSEGTYTLTITDFAGASLPPITGIVLTAPNPLLVSATLPSVCPGSPTTLSVNGATTGYTWTANPVDPSLTTPNSASITVSPTQTTTYTASTGKNTTATNLILNGDFELGNIDFTSDYDFVVNLPKDSQKKAYNIVKNPELWFKAFEQCSDKTSGFGNMFVADGSTNSNDKVWVQNGVFVEQDTDYDFSYYLQNVVNDTPAKIEIYINGVSLGAPVAGSSTACNWVKQTYKWNSGSNSFASIVIYNRETSGGGNDFAIDDISLVESVVCPLSKSITITVNSTLTLNIINPAPICSGGTVDITLPDVTLGSTTGTILTYWTDNLATNTLSNPSAITTSGTYYIKSTLNSCSIIKPVVVTIATAPTAVAQTFCNSATVANLVATGSAIKWYAALTSGTALASTTALTTGTTYYASQTVGTCESTRTAVVVTITPATAPTAVAQTFCTSATVANLVATGSAIKWYADLTSGTALASTTALTTGTTYYASETVGTCESTRTAVVVTISPATAPTAVAQTFCASATVDNLIATGTAIKWYAASTGGTALATTTNVISGTYYASQTINGCESSRTSVLVKVNPKTTPTFTATTAICSGDTLFTLPLSSNNSITGTWLPIFDNTTSETYTFTPTAGECATTAPLTITVNPNIPPTFTPVPDICIGSILSPLPLSSIEAITGTWSPPLDNTTTTTYTFTPTAGLCATTTDLTITINTSATINPSFDTVDPICVGGVLSDLPLISKNAIKGTWSPPLNKTATTIYTFTPNLGQCAANTTLQIEVFDIPIVQANAVSSSICSGSSTSITLSSNFPTTTFNWNAINSNVTGGTAGSGDKIIQKISTVGNQSGEVVYAITPSANGCNGLTILVPIIVNPIPQVSASTNFQTICSGGSTTIELSSEVGSTTFDWTVIQTGVLGGLSGNDSTIVQTLTTTDIKEGFANYIVTPKFNNCFGTPLTVVVRVNPIPAIFGTSGGDICSGNYTNIKLIPNPNIPLTTFEWTANPIDVTGAKDDSGEDVIEQLLETVTGGSVTYTVTPSYGGCKGNPSLVKINVDPLPKPNLKDGKICIEKATGNTLNPYLLETNLNNPNFEFEWYFESVKINGATQNSYEAAAIGKYSVLVFNKLTGCTSKETFATLTETFPANSYTIEQTAAFSENASISITVDGDINEYLYKLDDGAWQSSNVFSGISSGLHTVSITDIEGCTSFTDTVTIIDYPKFFTPNGDGFNDTWNVVGLGENANAKLSIYDRYGKLVKQISSDGTGWDGTFNNQLLPATDYWFTINYFENKIEKLFKAHFSLKR